MKNKQNVLDWAKEKGMQGVHGPLGFTNLDHQAIMIEGFDHLPSIASEYHLSYYLRHFEAAGYGKEMDWVEFRLKQEKELPAKALKLNDMIRNRYGLKVVHFTNRKELKAYANKIFDLLNIAFGELFGFVKIKIIKHLMFRVKELKKKDKIFLKSVNNLLVLIYGFNISVLLTMVYLDSLNL